MLPPPAGYSSSDLIFDDQFNEPSLNTSYWHPWTGNVSGMWGDWNGYEDLLPYPYSGFATTSIQPMYNDPYPYGGGSNTTGNHLVGGNGTLSLIATPSNKFSNLGYGWASAGISSYGLVELPATGGYVQWEAKMPDLSAGAWAGLWLLSPTGQEFDVQESGYRLGNSNFNDVLAANWHGGAPHQVILDTGVDLSADYHTYGLEYAPGQSFTEFLDGQQVAQWTQNVPFTSFELLTDLEIAGPSTASWHSTPTASNRGPFELDVKDIQVYSSPNTSTGGLTLFGDSTPTNVTDNDPNAVDLGVKFQSSSNGTITGIRFYKGPQNTGTHLGDLWNTSGTLLASATFTNETASGWQQVSFSRPVSITAGTTYIASYHTNTGEYSANQNFFASSRTNGPLTAPSSSSSGGNGVYAYGSANLFPNSSFNASNYWVDVVFNPQLSG